MAVSRALLDALATFASIERDLIEISVRHDDARKHALVKARRHLAEQMGRIGSLLGQEPSLAERPHEQARLGKAFTTMRYRLASHQADWPAVIIDEHREGHLRSSDEVRDKADAFWSACRDILGVDRLSFAQPGPDA